MTISNDFFASLGFGYHTTVTGQYAALESIKWSQLGCQKSESQLGNHSTTIATSIQQHLQVMRGYDAADLQECGYPTMICKDLSDTDWGELQMMRLGYIVDGAGEAHLIEVNAQTPSFWWECETGRQAVLKKLGVTNSDTTQITLKNALKAMLASAKNWLGNDSGTIGLVVGDAEEDIFQMNWVLQQLKTIDPNLKCEVLTISRLDVEKKSHQPFSLNTGSYFDTLFLWYPLEWLATARFQDEQAVWPALIQGLKKKKWYLANWLAAFLVQNKYFLADLCIQNPSQTVITPTVSTLAEIEQISMHSWIAKPIWGRQGLAVFGNNHGQEFFSDFNDEYYNNQWYAYQPYFTPKSLEYRGKSYTYTLEQWVYYDGDTWQSGGSGLRLNLAGESITNDNSRWLVIENASEAPIGSLVI